MMQGLILHYAVPLTNPVKVVGILPVFGSCDQLGLYRVEVDAPAQVDKVLFPVNPCMAKAIAELLTHPACASTEVVSQLDHGAG